MPSFLCSSLLAAASLLALALVATACGGTTPAGTTGGDGQLAERGAQLFTQFGCNTCHSTSGQRIVGPPLNGLYNKRVRLENGQTVTADEAYLRESILDPDAKIVLGYQKGVMVGAIGPQMDEIKRGDHVDALIAYIKSLR